MIHEKVWELCVMTINDITIYEYIIVFHGNISEYDGNYRPIVEETNDPYKGTMHGLDPKIIPVKKALAFIMHLPRISLDLHDLDELMIASSHDTAHHIQIIPDFLLTEIKTNSKPTLIVYSDDCEDIKKNSIKVQLGFYAISELKPSLIMDIWNKLSGFERYTDCDRIVPDIDKQFLLEENYIKLLPQLFYARQYNSVSKAYSLCFTSDNIDETIARIYWENTVHEDALVDLLKQGATKLDDNQMRILQTLEEEKYENLRPKVVITFPGVPIVQKNRNISARTITFDELDFIRLLGIHRAIAKDALLLEIPITNDVLFKIYNELEIALKDTRGTNGSYVQRVLKQIGKEIWESLSELQKVILFRADEISVFSDFPIGMAILPHCTAPIQCSTMVSYHHLTPLTRAVQIEMTKHFQLSLKNRCRVAFVECVSDTSDNRYVRFQSELVYKTLKKYDDAYENFNVKYYEAYSVTDIKRIIDELTDTEILYISAHGFYDRGANCSGIYVGEERWMGDIERIPPVVILSACHTSPRGSGCVNIADLLLRAGALTVLSTFIPIRADKNTIIMTRLFTYITLAQKGSKQYKTLADLWRGVAASNAINEIAASSDGLKNWLTEKNKNGIPRIMDIELNRCNVRGIRPNHIYEDTISIIKEVLREEGMEGKFDDVLSQQNYIPECLFYQFSGYPENVFIYSEFLEGNMDPKRTG